MAIYLGMATPTVKSTYVLDLESAETLERLSREWNVSKSEVLRRAIKAAGGSSAVNRVDLFRKMQATAALTPAAASRWARSVREERRATQAGGQRRRS